MSDHILPLTTYAIGISKIWAKTGLTWKMFQFPLSNQSPIELGVVLVALEPKLLEAPDCPANLNPSWKAEKCHYKTLHELEENGSCEKWEG